MRWRPTILVLSAALGLGGCARAGVEQTLTVFAAASLTEPFRALERAFEAEHPGVDVVVSFAGSQLLATQLLEGAPAQVFASADAAQLDRVAAERTVVGRRVLASNRLVIVVPVGSAITELTDLAEPGVRVVLAGATVPAGRYARQALERLPVDSVDLLGAVERNLVSNETDVRGVVTKVRLGEADAGVAYATDVLGDPSLELREFPPIAAVVARYEIAALSDGRRDAVQAGEAGRNRKPMMGRAGGRSRPESALDVAALEFVEFVTSPAGQAILADYGFGPAVPDA
jgi:molybdate transport system substrate-binding protein